MKKFNTIEANQLAEQVAKDVKAFTQAVSILKDMNSDHLSAVLGDAHYDIKAMDNRTLMAAYRRINARAWQEWLWNNNFGYRYHHNDRKAQQAVKTLVYADLHNDRRHDGISLSDMEDFTVQRAEEFFNEWLADTPRLISTMLNEMRYAIGTKEVFSKKFTFKTTTYRSDCEYRIANMHYAVALAAGLDFTYQQFYTAWHNTNMARDGFNFFNDAELISFEVQASGNYTVRLRADIADELNNMKSWAVIG